MGVDSCFLDPDESIFFPGIKPNTKSTFEYLKNVNSLILAEYNSFLGNSTPALMIAEISTTDNEGKLLKDVCMYN
jgi:hypothetical protein